MKILAIGAHPDDLEILCGGTLAKYSQKGHKIFMTHLCNGSMGSRKISSKELIKIRAQEAKESAHLIKAESLGPIAEDLDLYPTKEMRLKVIDIIRSAKPDIIITHSVTDYMPDHIITGQIVFDSAFTATLPLYKTTYPAYENIVPIYSMDTIAGIRFKPTIYVDITESFEVKKKMFLCHKSQYQWLKSHHSSDPINLIESMGKFRGIQCGVEYAETFKRVDVWGRIKPSDLDL